jgi:hypothetical protein
MKSEALLAGRIFDDHGHRMTPSHARKRGIKYRYYISSALVQGQQDQAGSIRRVSAPEIEALIVKSVRKEVGQSAAPKDDPALIHSHVVRIDVRPDRLVVELAHTPKDNSRRKPRRQRIEIPWRKTWTRRRREILLPESASPQTMRPIRSENRTLLVASIARGRRWLNEIIFNPDVTVEAIAKREHCSTRKVNMTISLAFLAPGLVQAAINGRLPHGMGMTRLCDLPAEWSRQYGVVGLSPT